MSNYAEMLAGTDPTDPASLLVLESVPRPADLTDAERQRAESARGESARDLLP